MAKSRLFQVLGLGAIFITAACGTTTGSHHDPEPDLPMAEGDGADEFVSHVAGQSVARGPANGSADSALGTGGAMNAGAPASADSNGAQRAISEADIIQLDGNRLYALSQYAGLTIVDIGDPSNLRVLGTHRSAAVPFEMYLRDGLAYVMQNGYYTRSYDEDLGQETWQSTARMVALDVSDPSDIRVVADHEVPGEISDSRAVGDVIYLVTFEDGYCWRCDALPNTRVTSFDVSDPTAFQRVAELRFDSEQNSWGQRSIAVTTDRMYVAGPHWSENESGGSIQVIDISDPSGALTLGAEIEVAGIITNRWQMDEHDGVLRVVSQTGGWQSSTPPIVETFAVSSSEDLTPLGSLPMVLPRPEQLQSVRFDGDRGYVVTFERTDPLFTLDLSDPATPKQLGELEIPGWLYHMEPRGDRLYGLGFDDANDGRGLTVSIFDVSDLGSPTMLDRVVFGGNWASMAEDQDRIHKAFNLALDRGLILVPFSGYDYDERGCTGGHESGIQIIDVEGDDLTLRGAAPQIGSARRSLLVDETLFGISDNAVQAFDISNRDAPRALDDVEVARNISSVHVMDGTVLRFGSDWWTGRTQLDFVNANDAASIEPLGELDLSDVLPDENSCDGSSSWGDAVYVHGNWGYVPRSTYRWSDDGSTQEMTIYVLDLRDRSAPRIAGSFDVDPTESNWQNGSDYESFGEVLLTDSALLVGRVRGNYRYDPVTGERSEQEYFYDIFDLTDPGAPAFTKRYQVPGVIAGHGWGYAPMGCGLDMGWGWWRGGYGTSSAIVSGDLVVSNHEEPLDDETGRVRYFLDRLDVSDPKNPKMLPPVNIPGQVVFFDGESGIAVTLEDDLRTVDADDWEACQRGGGRAWFDSERGECRIYDRILNSLTIEGDRAIRAGRVNLDRTRNSQQVAVSGERVFVATTERVDFDWEHPVPVGRFVESYALIASGRLEILPETKLDPVADAWWWPNLVARGTRAFITDSNTLMVVDTAEKAEPRKTEHEMPGYTCGSLQVEGNRAYCAMYEHGVLTFEL